jgi:Cd2+/Zn2+-exporting ATPase
VKGATYLDVVAGCKTVAFDKTGTLTEGNFALLSVSTENKMEREEILALASAVEKNSAHPIAAAFAAFDKGYVAENVNEIAGQGMTAEINGETVLVGNATLLKAHGVTFDEKESLNTLVYVAKGGKLLGIAEIGDKLRDSAKSAILELKKLGVERSVMLTGDNLARARKIANEVGMYEVKAELLPNEKLDEAEKLKKNGGLLYVGDGINDAPVMSAADCAVSMGTLGSAAAVEASDMVLISDDLTSLPKGIRIARKTKSIVKQNIVFSIGMKPALMVLGLLGWLPLWLAVFADVGVMLLAVLNSFRVRIAK